VTAACAFDKSRNRKNRWNRVNLSKYRVRVAAMTQALPHCSNWDSVIAEAFGLELAASRLAIQPGHCVMTILSQARHAQNRESSGAKLHAHPCLPSARSRDR
jgi:hypothetical protein